MERVGSEVEVPPALGSLRVSMSHTPRGLPVEVGTDEAVEVSTNETVTTLT